MRRGIKIGIAVAGLVVVLPVVGIIAIIGLFVGVSQFNRDVSLLGKYSLQIMAVDHRRKTAESQRTWFFTASRIPPARIGRDRMVWR
jgi:hypothetical protein